MTEDLDDILAARISTEVATQVAAALNGVLQGNDGPPGPPGADGEDGADGQDGEDGVAISFPSPFIAPGHFDAGWTEFKTQRSALGIRARSLPQASGAKIVADTVSGLPANAFAAPVRMADGGSYFIPPRSSSSARIYRAATKAAVWPAGAYWGADGYSSAALGWSKKVLLAPYCADHLCAFNPQTEAVEILKTGLGSGTYKFSAIDRGPNNLLVLAPHNSAYLATFDEATATWAQSAGVFTVAYGYGGHVALPNGDFIGVPHMATKVYRWNHLTGAITFGAAVFPGAESFWGGAMIDDTHAIFYPHKHDRPVIYDTVNDTFTAFPVATGSSGTANHRGGVMLADERHFLSPFQTAAKIIDVANGTVVSCAGSYSGGAVGGACLMDSGDVLLSPFNAGNVCIAATGNGFALDPEFVLSPHV